MYYASYTGDVKQANGKKYIDQNSSDADIEAILKSAIVSPGAVDITDFSFSLTRTLKKELLGFSAENEGSQKFCFIVDVNCQPSSASKIAVVDEMKENGVNFSIICNMLNDNGSDYEALCSDGRYSVWNPDYSYTITSKVLDQKNDVISYDYYTGVLNGITLASEITTDWYDAATGKLQPHEIRELELPDTDNDGLYDFDEIVWDDIQISNGTVQLPTLDDLCSKNKIAAKGMMDFTVLAKSRGFNVDAANTKVLVLKSNPLQEDSDGDGYSDIEDPDRVRQPDYLEKYDFLDQEIFSVSFEHSIKNLENSNKAATAGNANKNDVQKFKFEWRDKENGYTISALSDSANVLTVSGITESDGTLGFTNYQGNKEQLWEVLPFYREGYEYSSEYRYGLIIRSKAMTLGGAPLYLRCIDDAVSVSNERNYSCRIFLKPVSDWKWFGDMYMRFEGWLSNNEDYSVLKNTLEKYQDNIIVATGLNGFLQNSNNKQDNVLTVSQYNTDVLAGQHHGVFPNVKFAEVPMDHVSCEIIATYNALKMKGIIQNDNEFKYFFKLAVEFEFNAIIPFVKKGAFGNNPYKIDKCLDAYNCSYLQYGLLRLSAMDKDTDLKDIVIVSEVYYSLDNLGLHTYVGYRDSSSGEMIFINRINSTAHDENANGLSKFSSIAEATVRFKNITVFETGYILK